jgi:hypothetical protein
MTLLALSIEPSVGIDRFHSASSSASPLRVSFSTSRDGCSWMRQRRLLMTRTKPRCWPYLRKSSGARRCCRSAIDPAWTSSTPARCISGKRMKVPFSWLFQFLQPADHGVAGSVGCVRNEARTTHKRIRSLCAGSISPRIDDMTSTVIDVSHGRTRHLFGRVAAALMAGACVGSLDWLIRRLRSSSDRFCRSSCVFFCCSANTCGSIVGRSKAFPNRAVGTAKVTTCQLDSGRSRSESSPS